jgi:hypothetical protein
MLTPHRSSYNSGCLRHSICRLFRAGYPGCPGTAPEVELRAEAETRCSNILLALQQKLDQNISVATTETVQQQHSSSSSLCLAVHSICTSSSKLIYLCSSLTTPSWTVTKLIMASPSLIWSSTRPNLYVCARCAFNASNASGKVRKRWLGQHYINNLNKAEKDWQARATEIREGRQKSMLTILEERGLVQSIAG